MPKGPRREKRPPVVIDADFTVVGQEKPKPWWRRLRLAPGWWFIAGMSLMLTLSQQSGH